MDVIRLNDDDVQYYREKISKNLERRSWDSKKEGLGSLGRFLIGKPKKGQGGFSSPLDDPSRFWV
jgi:hypothetical protein